MNVFIGILVGFLIGVGTMCLFSTLYARIDEVKTDTEDELKQFKIYIREMENRVREKELQQIEQKAQNERRIKQTEEAIENLNRAMRMKDRGRHEASSKEGGE